MQKLNYYKFYNPSNGLIDVKGKCLIKIFVYLYRKTADKPT